MGDGNHGAPAERERLRAAEREPPRTAVAFVSRDGRVLDASPRFVAALGSDGPTALSHVSHLDELPADVARAIAAQVAAVLDGTAQASGVELSPDASRDRWSAHVIAMPTPTPTHTSTENDDAMTVVFLEHASSAASGGAAERPDTETALGGGDQLCRQMVEHFQEVFFITDERASKVLYVNPAFEEVFGRSRAALYDSVDTRIESIHPDDRARVIAALDKSSAGQHDTTYRIVRPDGSLRWVHDRGYLLRSPDGGILTSGLVTDITAERTLHESLAKAQKLESISRLAGGLAHEFNNLLSVILTCAELGAQQLPSSSPVQAELESVREAGMRAAALTQQLLALANRQVIQATLVDLTELARAMRGTLRDLVGEAVTVEMRLAPAGATVVWADRRQLEQVLTNLVSNARGAMVNGGRLTIEISVVDHAAPSSDVEDLPAGEYVRLTVEDEGGPIATSDLERIFEPFFAIRGRGAGLELATSRGIVAQAGGRLFAQSKAETGAVFELLLPRARRPELHRATTKATPSLRPSGVVTILVVEDLAPLRKAAVAILGKEGYVVLSATDGVDALKVASEHGGVIDLLVSDVVMPKMGGVELAERLLALRPATKVLFTSGFTEGADLNLASGAAFLPKPYGVDTLLGRVRELLGD